MIELCRQETEVAFCPGLEPERCHCAAERKRKVNRFVSLAHPFMRFSADKTGANYKSKTGSKGGSTDTAVTRSISPPVICGFPATNGSPARRAGKTIAKAI